MDTIKNYFFKVITKFDLKVHRKKLNIQLHCKTKNQIFIKLWLPLSITKKYKKKHHKTLIYTKIKEYVRYNL